MSVKHKKNKPERSPKGGVGEIHSADDGATVVKLMGPDQRLEEFEVQIYGDGFCNFYYGVDYHGEALYYSNGEWLPYEEIGDCPFPDFVEPVH